MKNNIIYYNGKYSYYKDINIGLLSSSLNFGTSVIDSIRLYKKDNSIYSIGLVNYYNRFLNSVNNYIYDFDIDFINFKKIIITLLKLNKNIFKHPYLRLIIFQSDSYLNINNKNYDFAIIPFSLNVPYGKLNGIISPEKRNNNSIYEYKLAYQYGKNLHSTKTGNKSNNEISIFTDTKGNLLESMSENIFFVKENIVYTPPKGIILRGVNRELIISYLESKDIIIKEKNINISEVYDCDEIIICGSATGIRSLISINGKKIKGKSFKYYNIIKELYNGEYTNFKKLGNIKIEKLL